MHYSKSKKLRLPEYDYSQPGWYFITLTTRNHSCLFGSIENATMVLNDAGQMVETTWQEIPIHYPQIELDIFQVMPDHFHGILIIRPESHTSVRGKAVETVSLITVMEQYKSITTNRYIRGVKEKGWNPFSKKLWDTSFYDHVIRNESALRSVQEYINNNVRKWELTKPL